MPINRNLVSAPLADLRRLSLLAELARTSSEGEDADPGAAAKVLQPVFSGLPACLSEDITALCEEELVIRDPSLASTSNVTVLAPGRELVAHLKTSVDTDQDALTAVVAAMVLHYMHTHKDRARSTPKTESLRGAGITVFGTPLPDGCVEEVLMELHDLGLIDGTKAYGGTVLLPSVNDEGRKVLRKGRPVLLPDDGPAGASSSVFNTTINGGVQGQNVAVASQGDVYQEATTVNADQAMADLRIAVDALYTALEGQTDLQDKIEELLKQLDEAEDQKSKSLMARALSGLSRLAQRVVGKVGDTAVALAVPKAVTPLLEALSN